MPPCRPRTRCSRPASKPSSPTPTPRRYRQTSIPRTGSTSSRSTRSRCATCSRTRPAEVVQDANEPGRYFGAALAVRSGPILIDKYHEGLEVEVDAVCDDEAVLIPGIMEHIERAGVHSGASMAVYPPHSLTPAQRE